MKLMTTNAFTTRWGNAVRMALHGALLLASPDAGSEILVCCGDSHVPVRVPATGSWGRHEKVSADGLRLQSGANKIELRATAMGGEGVANVRSVRLVPVKPE